MYVYSQDAKADFLHGKLKFSISSAPLKYISGGQVCIIELAQQFNKIVGYSPLRWVLDIGRLTIYISVYQFVNI